MNTKHVSLLIGPAKYPEDDQRMVSLFLAEAGEKVICGISTAKMVSRQLTSLDNGDLSNINGLILVTDGTIILSEVLDILLNPKAILECHRDSHILANSLLSSDSISFLIGLAVNKSQRSLSLPAKPIVKSRLALELIELLRGKGKQVIVEYF